MEPNIYTLRYSTQRYAALKLVKYREEEQEQAKHAVVV